MIREYVLQQVGIFAADAGFWKPPTPALILPTEKIYIRYKTLSFVYTKVCTGKRYRFERRIFYVRVIRIRTSEFKTFDYGV